MKEEKKVATKDSINFAAVKSKVQTNLHNRRYTTLNIGSKIDSNLKPSNLKAPTIRVSQLGSKTKAPLSKDEPTKPGKKIMRLQKSPSMRELNTR